METLCRVADADIAGHLRSVVLVLPARHHRAYVLVAIVYTPCERRVANRFNAQQFLLEWYDRSPCQPTKREYGPTAAGRIIVIVAYPGSGWRDSQGLVAI